MPTDSGQAAAISTANSYTGRLDQFIGNLASLAGPTYSWSTVSFNNQVLQDKVNALITQAQGWTIGVVPTPDYVDPGIIDSVAVSTEPFPMPVITDIVAPDVIIPNAPATTFDAFDGNKPVMNDGIASALTSVARSGALPGAIAAPNLPLPSIPTVVFPTLDTLVPTADSLVEPTAIFDFAEGEYVSALGDSLKAKLLTDMAEGGYGIEPADELALWDRARERELVTLQTATDTATRSFAARGFMMPPGGLAAALDAAQDAAMERIAALSRDIALKRADLYVQNRQFVMKASNDLEQLSINMHLSVMERALNAAKAGADLGIALYNARVNRFNSLLDGFRASVQAYEADVRGRMATVDVYKAALDGVRAETDVARLTIQTHEANVQAARAGAEIYRADIDAVKAVIEIERLKLDVYKSEIEVYSETLRAETLKLQGYETQVRGQLASVEVYKAQVSAQNLKLEGAKVQAGVYETNARIGMENARTKLEVSKTKLQAYQANVQGVSASNTASTQSFQSRTELFRSLATLYTGMGQLGISEMDSISKTQIAKTNYELQGRLGAADSGARVLGTMISGALTGVTNLNAAIVSSGG